MPYALFEKEYRLSRAFPTPTDVWRCAEDCDLVVDDADGGQDSTTATQLSPVRPTPRKPPIRHRTG